MEQNTLLEGYLATVSTAYRHSVFIFTDNRFSCRNRFSQNTPPTWTLAIRPDSMRLEGIRASSPTGQGQGRYGARPGKQRSQLSCRAECKATTLASNLNLGCVDILGIFRCSESSFGFRSVVCSSVQPPSPPWNLSGEWF